MSKARSAHGRRRINEADEMKLDVKYLYEVFDEYLAIEDRTVIDALIGFWLAHRLGPPPVWIILMGPSSDGKTVLLDAFSVIDSVAASKITSKTIISGYTDPASGKDQKGTSNKFGRELNNKIWVVKDFSQIGSMRSDDRKEVFAQMRELYDGHIEARYGTGAKVSEQSLYVSFVAASTSDFEKAYMEQQALGTRHMIVRTTSVNDDKVLQKIRNVRGNEELMKRKLSDAVSNTLVKEFRPKWVHIPDDIERELVALTNILRTLRTYVSVDRYTNEVDEIPEIEGIGRAKKNIDKLYSGLMNIDGISEKRAIACIEHVVKSNIPRMRLHALKLIANDPSGVIIPANLTDHTKVGMRTAYRHLDSLYALGVIDKQGSEWKQSRYWLSEEWKRNYAKWFRY